jgi:hypothetical protein
VAELESLRGAGRHVTPTPVPLDDAELIADELGGELVLPEDAERTLGALAALVDDRAGSRLRGLATELGQAERILARAEARVLATFEASTSVSGTGLAIHPQTLRDAASAVRAARAAHDRAVAELDALDGHGSAGAGGSSAVDEPTPNGQDAPASAPSDDAVSDSDRDSGAPAAPGERPSLSALHLAVVGAGIGISLALFGLRMAPVAPLPAIVAVAWVVIVAVRGRTRPEVDDEGAREASENLAFVNALTDGLYSGRLPASSNAIATAAARRRQLLELDRDSALERLRVAERHWHELAGADADPADVEALLVRRDPQRHRAGPWVRESSPVRTASTFLGEIKQRWDDVWSLLGHTSPNSADAETAIGELEADAAAVVALGRPVVVVAPPPSVDDAIETASQRLSVVVVSHDPDAEPVAARASKRSS